METIFWVGLVAIAFFVGIFVRPVWDRRFPARSAAVDVAGNAVSNKYEQERDALRK